jgi:hypothetical protein
MAEAQVRHGGHDERLDALGHHLGPLLVWARLCRPRMKLLRRKRYASPPRRSRSGVIMAFAAAATIVPGCWSDARDDRAAEIAREALVSSERTTGGGDPSAAVLAGFALEYLFDRMVSEDEAEETMEWYFVDAAFAPFAYDGRLYPPEDTRAWVQRVEPLSQADREKLEGIGFTICNLGDNTYIYCDGVAEVGIHDHLFLGIGEVRRLSERRWYFDVGFGVMARSGVSIGGARIAMRSHNGAWVLTSVRTLWVDH